MPKKRLPFTLHDFIVESNMIESINREPTDVEVEAHKMLLALPVLTIGDVSNFVRLVAGDRAVLRRNAGQDVYVGNHQPMKGGPEVEESLRRLLVKANQIKKWGDVKYSWPYYWHCEYEYLHPFMDGNGRSGRAIWLWLIDVGIDGVPLGFLHTWYYQSLDAYQKPMWGLNNES